MFSDVLDECVLISGGRTLFARNIFSTVSVHQNGSGFRMVRSQRGATRRAAVARQTADIIADSGAPYAATTVRGRATGGQQLTQRLTTQPNTLTIGSTAAGRRAANTVRTSPPAWRHWCRRCPPAQRGVATASALLCGARR